MNKELRRKLLKIFAFVFMVFAYSLFLVKPIQAQPSVLDGSTKPGGVPCTFSDCAGSSRERTTTDVSCKQYCGDYQLNDGMLVVKRVSDIILAVVGSLSLIAFVIGGVMFLVSGGNQNMITRGKATIIGAVIGLFIVFFSYTVISFITKDILQNKTVNTAAPEVGL